MNSSVKVFTLFGLMLISASAHAKDYPGTPVATMDGKVVLATCQGNDNYVGFSTEQCDGHLALYPEVVMEIFTPTVLEVAMKAIPWKNREEFTRCVLNKQALSDKITDMPASESRKFESEIAVITSENGKR